MGFGSWFKKTAKKVGKGLEKAGKAVYKIPQSDGAKDAPHIRVQKEKMFILPNGKRVSAFDLADMKKARLAKNKKAKTGLKNKANKIGNRKIKKK